MEQIRISDSEIIYQRRRVFIFIGECKSDCSFRSNNFILSMFIQQINLDTSLCVDSLLPQIFSHYEQMKDTFNQIDTLEAGVKTVEASISSMELELSKAEAQLGSESVFKTVFRPFLVPPLLQSSILFIYTYYQLFFLPAETKRRPHDTSDTLLVQPSRHLQHGRNLDRQRGTIEFYYKKKFI